MNTIYPVDALAKYVTRYDFEKLHRTICQTDPTGCDIYLLCTPIPVALIRYGRIDVARLGLKHHLEAAKSWLADGFEFALDRWIFDAFPALLCTPGRCHGPFAN